METKAKDYLTGYKENVMLNYMNNYKVRDSIDNFFTLAAKTHFSTLGLASWIFLYLICLAKNFWCIPIIIFFLVGWAKDYSFSLTVKNYYPGSDDED